MFWNDVLQGFEIPDERADEHSHETRMNELHHALSNHAKKMEQIKKEFEGRRDDFKFEQSTATNNLEINPALAEMDKELSKLLD